MGSAIPLPARCLAPRVQNNIRFWQWGNFHLMSHPTKRCALPQRRGPHPPFLVLLSYFTSLAPLGARPACFFFPSQKFIISLLLIPFHDDVISLYRKQIDDVFILGTKKKEHNRSRTKYPLIQWLRKIQLLNEYPPAHV